MIGRIGETPRTFCHRRNSYTTQVELKQNLQLSGLFIFNKTYKTMKISNPKILMLLFILGAISCEDKLDINSESGDVMSFNNSLSASQGKVANTVNGLAIIKAPLYDGSDAGPLDLNLAKSWVAKFKGSVGPDEIQSRYFGRDVIDQILAQQGCTGLRIYYAINDGGEKVLIISGVDSTGTDMLPVSPTLVADENTLADASLPCPGYCPDGL